MEQFLQKINNLDSNKIKEFNDKVYELNKNDPEYWNFLIYNTELKTDMIINNLDKMDIFNLIKYQKLNKEILLNNNFSAIIDEKKLYNDILKNQKLDSEFLEIYVKKDINWDYLCLYQNLTVDFIKKYSNEINWEIISENQLLNFDILAEYHKKINWEKLSKNIKSQYLLNDTFIDLFKNENIWDCLIWSNNISNENLYKYLDKLNYDQILDLLKIKKLDENIIDEILNKYNDDDIYESLIEGQNLTEDFVKKHINEQNINLYIKFQKVDILFLLDNCKIISLQELSYNDYLTEDLLLELYPDRFKFKEDFDWEYLSEFMEFSKKGIVTFKEIDKSLLLKNDILNI